MKEGVLDKLIGIKFFNIFGANEYHKGEYALGSGQGLRSNPKDGKIPALQVVSAGLQGWRAGAGFPLCKGRRGRRLRIYAGQRLRRVVQFGRCQARTWNELAKAVFCRAGDPAEIEYIEMPETLREKYQYHTQADMSWTKKKRSSPSSGHSKTASGTTCRTILSKDDPYL